MLLWRHRLEIMIAVEHATITIPSPMAIKMRSHTHPQKTALATSMSLGVVKSNEEARNVAVLIGQLLAFA